MATLNREYRNFKYGIVDRIEARTIPAGASSRSLNWLTKGDKIELVRGRFRLGTENTGTGRISGLHVAYNALGTELLYKTYAQKLKYYSTTTSDWVEVGTNQLGSAADDQDISFANYHSLAGAQLWLCSPDSSLYKILTANPGSINDQYVAARNFQGYISIRQNRMVLWHRKLGSTSGSVNAIDRSGVYLSYIDDSDGYTTVSAEALGSVASGTLGAVTGDITCFALKITHTASGETFSDNGDGTLTGSVSATGTINYTTGAFTTTLTGAGTADYLHEDATSGGIADFSKSAPRTAGQGALFRQNEGGPVRTIKSLENVEYCFHERNLYQLTLTATDTSATNLKHREGTGIPANGAAVETGDGIYYVDDTDENDTQIRLLSIAEANEKVIPVSISLNLNLTDYRFNLAEMVEWGYYIVVACRHKDSTKNNRLLFYDRIWKSWDYVDYYASKLAVYNGILHVGDSLSNNVYEIMSGLDDDGSFIGNYWEGWNTDLEIDGLKKVKRLVLQGEIGPDQEIEVWISYDSGVYVSIGTILGSGTYVDKAQSVSVGALTLGRGEIGGGGGSVTAYNYERELVLRSDKFELCKLKFVANKLGYASISTIKFKDIRFRGNKLPTKYRA